MINTSEMNTWWYSDLFSDITPGPHLLIRMSIVSYPLWACSEEPCCCQSPWTETRPVPSVHLEACRLEEGYQLVKRQQRERVVRRWRLLQTNGLPLQSPGASILIILYRKLLRILWKPFSVRFHKSLTSNTHHCSNHTDILDVETITETNSHLKEDFLLTV